MSTEQHRQGFQSLDLGDNGRPFVLVQQLRHVCRKWLLAGGGDVEQILDRVVLEQLVGSSPEEDCRVGPVPQPDVARPGHPIGGGPDGGVPSSLRIPAICFSLPLLSLRPLILSHFLVPIPPRGPPPESVAGPRAPSRGGWGKPAWGPQQYFFHCSLHVSSLTHFLPLGRWGGLGRLLAVWGPRAFHRLVPSDGGGGTDPGPGHFTDCPRSSWLVPNTCEY